MKTSPQPSFIPIFFVGFFVAWALGTSGLHGETLPADGEKRMPPSDDPGPRSPGNEMPPPQPDPTAVAPSKKLTPGFSNVLGSWFAQGPTPISGGQVEGMTNGYVCGAVNAVLAHPSNANIVYIGSTNGGVWKTTNATAADPTWTPTMDSLGSLSIGALAFDTNDVTSNTVWAGIGTYSSWYRLGGSRSGLLKSTDGGTSWSVVDGGGILAGKNIAGIVVRGNTIVLAVNVADSFTYGNIGIWRSTNGGASFTQMSVGNGTGPTGLPAGVCYDIVGTTAAPNTLYTSIAIPSTVGAQGIYKSTDLGATWSRVSTAAINNFFTNNTSNCRMSAGNANNAFFGIMESGAPVAIYGTVDGGANWSRMDLPTMPITSATTFTVTGATNASPIVITTSAAHGYSTNNYVEIAGVTGNTAANGTHQITFLSSTTFALDFSTGNGAYVSGGTARKITSSSPRGTKGPETGAPEEIAGGQGSIHFSILADPSNPNLVYLGGDRQDTPFTNFIGANDYSGNLWRGDLSLAPNGLSPSSQWKHLTHGNAIAAIPGGGTANNSSPHADSRDMAVDVNGSLIEVDDGGVFRRTSPQNNTGAWTSMAGNLQISESHSVAYDTVSNVIISGNQDNGTSVQNSTSGIAYTAVSTGDGGDVAVSINPANAAQSIRYSSFQNLSAGFFRKRIMSNANTLVSQTFPALTPQGGAPALVGQFTTPVEVNTVNANRLILGASNGIYESTDQGSTISRITTAVVNDGGSGGHTMICGGRKTAVDNAEVLYVASGSTILRRVAAAVVPAAVAGYAGATVRGIITDPEDYDHLFAIDNNQVFRSTDGGATFTDITGDIPAAAKDFRSLEFIRSGTEWAVVVGTLRGVYAARGTAPTDWGLVGGNMPNVYVWDMDYDAADNVLVVSTLGRGVWRFSNARDIAQVPEIALEQPSGTGLNDGLSTVSYGNVNTGGSSPRTFTIRNIGTGPLNISNVAVTGGNSASFSINTAGMSSSVPAATTTTFTVSFNPTATGPHSTTLQVTSDDEDETVFDVALDGQGVVSTTFPVSGPLGSVLTGVDAPNAAGVSDGTKFDVLKRGGFLAENGQLVFPGNLLIGTGGVTLSPNNFMGLWKQVGGSLTQIARSGNSAPETGATAAKYDVLPQTPAINDSGEVTFLASLAVNPSSTPPTTTDNDTGLWSELGGTGLGILIREGDVIPLLPAPPSPLQVGAFASGAFASAHTGAATGEAAFAITIRDGANLTDTAILRTSITGASVTAVGLVARENAAAPGTAENFNNLAGTYSDPVRMDATGNLAFVALTKPSNKEGLWYQPVAGATAKVFVAGDTAPGTTGATFKNIKSPAIGGEGTITFRGLLNNDGDNADGLKNDGIWRGTTAGGFFCILRRGDDNTNRAGLGLPVGAKVGNLWHGWLTNANHTALRGWLDLNGDGSSAPPADVQALYSDLSGTMALVIKVTDPAPDIAGATLATVDLPIVGGVEQMAFLGTVTGGGTTSANNKGVWRSAANGGALSLVLRTGDTMTTSQGVKTIQKVDFPGSGSTDRRWEQPIMDSTGRLLVYVTFTDNATTQVLVP